MKCLHIQLQPELCAGDPQPLVDDLTTFAPDGAVSVKRGDDNGPYINVDIETADVAKLWSAVSSRIASDSTLASCVIVCTEGDDGWDDYLLLHHYDRDEALDTLS